MRHRRDLISQIDQFIGGIAHGRNHDDHALAGALGGGNSGGNALDALGISNGGASKFLDYQSHCQTISQSTIEGSNISYTGYSTVSLFEIIYNRSMRQLFYALRRRFGGLVARKSIGRTEWANFKKNLRPINAGWNLIRVGSDRDGGYLVPNDLSGLRGCISPGVSNMVDFELSLSELNIPSILYDASINSLPIENHNFKFRKAFIGSPLNKDFVSLKEATQEFSDLSDTSLLLQMDIEGDELSAFHTLLPEDFDKYRIIIIEFHRLQDWTNRTVFDSLVKPVFMHLLEKFDIVHVHPNNCDGEFYFAGGFFPRAIEITFHHKSRRLREASPVSVPHHLDLPNTKYAPDIKLKF